jgi:malate synthase
MNMPVADLKQIKITKHSLASESAMRFANTLQCNDSHTNLNPSEILDQDFPLQNGSHKDVKEYVIYFCHMMAFFEDGSHCGLAYSKQFVAFSGHKEKPESIVLKGNNRLVEVILGHGDSINNSSKNETSISIEYPSHCTFTSVNGDDYIVE